jgi:hypothetical protein
MTQRTKAAGMKNLREHRAQKRKKERTSINERKGRIGHKER